MLNSNVGISLQEEILRKAVPVVINSYNQLTYIKNIVNKLTLAGFGNIYISDQCSNIQELIDYLSSGNGKIFNVFWSAKNNGPHDFFISGKYRIFAEVPFMYSDPDLDWDYLAPNYLTRLFEIAKKYNTFKVGSALTIPDPVDLKPGISFANGNGVNVTVPEHEAQFWVNELEANVYNSPIDTTMHLFLPGYYNPERPLITGLRVSGEGFQLKHLPWWKDDLMSKQEKCDYLLTASHNSWR